MINQLTNR